MTRLGLGLAAGLCVGLAAVASPTAAQCAGDCNRDNVVTIDELVTSVHIALGNAPVTDCLAADTNEDDTITVTELVQAVTAALRSCPPAVLPRFTDVTVAAGVDYVQQVTNAPPTSEAQQMAAGAAAGDYDGDGAVDLFVTRYDAPGILFRNRGDGTFVDVTAAAGLAAFNIHANGAAWCDVDNDGDLDLYVTALGPDEHRNYLFINDSLGHFSEEAVARGAAVEGPDPHYGFSVACGDYDRDGWLDLHTTEWRLATRNVGGARSNTRLLRNRGSAAPGFFSDVTDAAGVSMDGIATWTPVVTGTLAFTSQFSDLDGDGWPDLVVAADYGTSRLFWNRGDGTFEDGTARAMVGSEQNGMGMAIGDYDGDGLLDWFVTSIFDPSCTACRWGTTGNRLYHNAGGREFSDRTDAVGVRNGSWGWAASFLDYDNDGRLDLAMVNGVPFAPQFEHDQLRLWRNTGGVMIDVSTAAGVTDTRLGQGLVVFDYDGDGDLDLFIANHGDHPVLYRNDGGNTNTWLRIRLVGSVSNRQGIGARIVVTPRLGGPSQMREVGGGSNHLSQNETTVHFGLAGGSRPVARLEVTWPAHGTVQVLTDVPRNQLIELREPDS